MPNSEMLFLGGLALGAAIAFLVAFFLNRFNVFNEKVFGSVVSVVAGAVVTTFLGSVKGYAWVGYCFGLGLVLFFLVGLGHLRVKSPEAVGGKDARLKMLDALEKRHRDFVISPSEYDALKQAILEDIRKNPAISEAESRPTVNPNPGS